jgi:hypothetical protein
VSLQGGGRASRRGHRAIRVDSKRALEANVACQNLLGYTPEAILRLTSYQFSEVLIASPDPP